MGPRRKNLSLSENAIARAEALAKHYGTTFSGAVTKVINDAWEEQIRKGLIVHEAPTPYRVKGKKRRKTLTREEEN